MVSFDYYVDFLIQKQLFTERGGGTMLMEGYGALVLRLADEVVEALFVTYDLWK